MFTGMPDAALETAELARERESRLVRLQRLAEAMAEITADPERAFQERLDSSRKTRSRESLEADNCEIHLVKTEGVLSLIGRLSQRPSSHQWRGDEDYST